MFRNEFQLLKSLSDTLNHRGTPNFFLDEDNTALTVEEEKELNQYRDKDNSLDFTSVTSLKDLCRLMNNLRKKNKKETSNEDMSKYISSLIEEILPIMGVKEANVSVDTPAGKAHINVAQDKEPKIVYEQPDENTQESTLTYTVKNEDESETVLDVTKTVPVVEEEKLPFEDDITLSETLGTCEELIDLDMCEPKAKTVRLYDAPGVHNPQYYHAVKYICEELLFPFDNVYGYEDEDAPHVPDVMVILPNVWGKISSFDLDFVDTMMMENENITTYILDPETFELKNIDNIFDLYDYVMTTQQEETLY